MRELQLIARFTGLTDPERFKATAKELLTSVRDEDTGTLQYDWFYKRNEENSTHEQNTECVVLARYEDSSAVFEHIINLGKELLSGVLGQAQTVELEVFGEQSEELNELATALRESLSQATLRVYHYHQGL